MQIVPAWPTATAKSDVRACTPQSDGPLVVATAPLPLQVISIRISSTYTPS